MRKKKYVNVEIKISKVVSNLLLASPTGSGWDMDLEDPYDTEFLN